MPIIGRATDEERSQASQIADFSARHKFTEYFSASANRTLSILIFDKGHAAEITEDLVMRTYFKDGKFGLDMEMLNVLIDKTGIAYFKPVAEENITLHLKPYLNSIGTTEMPANAKVLYKDKNTNLNHTQLSEKKRSIGRHLKKWHLYNHIRPYIYNKRIYLSVSNPQLLKHFKIEYIAGAFETADRQYQCNKERLSEIANRLGLSGNNNNQPSTKSANTCIIYECDDKTAYAAHIEILDTDTNIYRDTVKKIKKLLKTVNEIDGINTSKYFNLELTAPTLTFQVTEYASIAGIDIANLVNVIFDENNNFRNSPNLVKDPKRTKIANFVQSIEDKLKQSKFNQPQLSSNNNNNASTQEDVATPAAIDTGSIEKTPTNFALNISLEALKDYNDSLKIALNEKEEKLAELNQVNSKLKKILEKVIAQIDTDKQITIPSTLLQNSDVSTSILSSLHSAQDVPLEHAELVKANIALESCLESLDSQIKQLQKTNTEIEKETLALNSKYAPNEAKRKSPEPTKKITHLFSEPPQKQRKTMVIPRANDLSPRPS